jgi:hypothetical protein
MIDNGVEVGNLWTIENDVVLRISADVSDTPGWVEGSEENCSIGTNNL